MLCCSAMRQVRKCLTKEKVPVLKEDFLKQGFVTERFVFLRKLTTKGESGYEFLGTSHRIFTKLCDITTSTLAQTHFIHQTTHLAPSSSDIFFIEK